MRKRLNDWKICLERRLKPITKGRRMDWADFNRIVGILGSIPIVIAALMVTALYWKVGRGLYERRSQPEIWFAHGIMASFTTIALNAAFWKITVRAADHYHRGELAAFIRLYGGFVDVLVMILTVWAAFCHLYSAYLFLDDSERPYWHWLTVWAHPKENSWPVRLLNKMLGRALRKD